MSAAQAQRLRAMESAMTVKLARARTHRALRVGPRRSSRALAAELLEVMPPHLQRMRADTFLEWVHKIGPSTALELLHEASVTDTRRLLSELSGRQRGVLVELLRGRPPCSP